MIGNSIHFKDHNRQDCKGRVLDKVLVEEEYFLKQHDSIVPARDYVVAITKYLVITPSSSIVLVKPNQIKKVL